MTKYRAKIIEQNILYSSPGRFQAWPSITQMGNGTLLVVFSDRLRHIDPFGLIMLGKSIDGGKNWQDFKVIADTPLDDRDPGIRVDSQQNILVTWSSSARFADKDYIELWKKNGKEYPWPQEAKKITEHIRAKWRHEWFIWSNDSGKNWSKPAKMPLTYTIKGPAILSSGDLMGFKIVDTDRGRMPFAQISSDRGENWQTMGNVPLPKGKYGLCMLNEYDLLEITPGHLLAAFRYEEMPDQWLDQREGDSVWFSESLDGGNTWSITEKRETCCRTENSDDEKEDQERFFCAHPPHLLKLKNGAILCTYGRRLLEPFRIRGCLSFDQGKTWLYESELKIASLPKHDDGYPATVQLPDGDLLTIYYRGWPVDDNADDLDEDTKKLCCIGQTRWKIETI